MFGIPFGPYAVASGTNMPNNTPEDMASLQKAYAAIHAANATPNGRVARGFAQFGPQPTGPQPPMLPTPPTPGPVNMGTPPGALSAQASAPASLPQVTPMPVPRPAAAPMAPADMGQASNIPIGNYQMPAFGPAPSRPSGPDVINKLLAFFHQKGADYEMPKSENGGG